MPNLCAFSLDDVLAALVQIIAVSECQVLKMPRPWGLGGDSHICLDRKGDFVLDKHSPLLPPALPVFLLSFTFGACKLLVRVWGKRVTWRSRLQVEHVMFLTVCEALKD